MYICSICAKDISVVKIIQCTLFILFPSRCECSPFVSRRTVSGNHTDVKEFQYVSLFFKTICGNVV